MRNVDKLIKMFCDPDFIAEHWQKQPRVWTEARDYFLKTARLSPFDKLIDRHWKLFPGSMSLYKMGRQIDYEQFQDIPGITLSTWLDLLKEHPVLIQQLYLSNEFFSQLSVLMQHFFGAFTPVSAYVSHGGTRGAKKHRDRGHVFVFQFQGNCKWILHDKNKRKKLNEVVMRPGMVMYIPQGVYHRVVRLSAFNLHVSMGLRYFHPRHELQCMLTNPVFEPALLKEHRNLNEKEKASLLAQYSDQPLKRDN